MTKEKKKELSDEEMAKLKDSGTGHGDRLEAIAQNVKKTHFEESGYEEPEETDEETDEGKDKKPESDEEADTETDEKPPESDEKKPSKDKKPKEKKTEEEMITLKVDGEEVEKPKAEVDKEGGIESYQKKLAADKRLQEATLKQKELEKKEAELAVREKALKSSLPDEDEEEEPATDEKDKKDASEDLKRLKDIVSEKRKAYHDAIEYGEAEDISKAAIELDEAQETYYETKFEGGKPTQELDVDKIADQIDAKLSQKQVLSKFQKEFDDVWKDPEAMARAKFEVNLLLESGKGNEWSTYEEAGKRARQQMGWEKPEEEDPTPEQTEEEKKRKEKIEKKRKIENIESANAKTEAPKTEEKPKTRKEVIEDMASKRVGSQL